MKTYLNSAERDVIATTIEPYLLELERLRAKVGNASPILQVQLDDLEREILNYENTLTFGLSSINRSLAKIVGGGRSPS